MSSSDEIYQAIQDELSKLSAAEASERFLSSFVNPQILCQATREEGPALWIVNRSDVYDETLKALQNHEQKAISERATEKLNKRQSSLILLDPPPTPSNLSEIPDHEAEDYLGHPLCPFEVILHFSHSLKEDSRASSALSLTRRLLEHPPRWLGHEQLKKTLSLRFGELLLKDPSAFVRLYAARVPLLESDLILQAVKNENNPMILSRILQNPACPANGLEIALDTISKLPKDAYNQRALLEEVWTLDSRLSSILRKSFLELKDSSTLGGLFNRLQIDGPYL